MTSPRDRRRQRRRVEKQMEQAWEAVARDDLVLAEKLSRRAAEQGHVNPRIWNERGLILLRCSRGADAEAAFRAAIALAPRYADAFQNLAALQAEHGKHVQAERLQRRAVELCATPEAEALLRHYQELLPRVPDLGSAPTAPDVAFTALTERFDWGDVQDELRRHGIARLPALLDRSECEAWIALAGDDGACEHAIEHDSAELGRVRWQFLQRPLPPALRLLRAELFARAVCIANAWSAELGRAARFPSNLDAFLEACARAGQHRSTPALRRYGPGGFEPPRRAPAGAVRFPLRLEIALGPDRGELELCDDRPGRKRRARALAAAPGDGVLLCAYERLVDIAGVPGLQPVRHAVAPVPAELWVLSVPFHDE